MLLKNILPNSLVLIVILLIIASCVPDGRLDHEELASGRIRDAIDIIYPKPGQVISAVDSTFILGNVPPFEHNTTTVLFINNHYVPVHRQGGFIAFLPITPGNFTFELKAYILYGKPIGYNDTTFSELDINQSAIKKVLFKNITVDVPRPLKPLAPDSLVIAKDINPPSGHLELTTGDRLVVSFLGTPGCRAWCAVAGLVDSLPMSETQPRNQSYWGEAVFGSGAIPDSMLIKGIYTGFIDIPTGVNTDSIYVNYYLSPPPKELILQELLLPPYNELEILQAKYLDYPDSVKATGKSSYSLRINNPRYPFTVEFTDSMQIIRHAPRRGYFSIFQPRGVLALVVGAEGEWYKAQLSKTQYAWVNKNSVRELPLGILPPFSYLKSIRTYDSRDNVVIEFPLAGKHPFKIIEDDSQNVRVQLFGVTSDTDWIRYDFDDTLIEFASWSQPEESVYEFKIKLRHDMWGYDAYYKGNSFYFKLNKPPDNVQQIKNKVIVVDPGHSTDPGSIGPTGYREADANLGIALALKKKLEAFGAKVIMTRDDDSHVPLYSRPEIAVGAETDLFVSIHNNALPDGVNPFVNNGTSVYYYHPHSINLARSILTEMHQQTGLNNYGLYYGNLAVNRPTQYPAVLVECAFMILPEHEAMLKTAQFRERVSEGIVRGIENFFRGYK